jgi:hypothetical protein
LGEGNEKWEGRMDEVGFAVTLSCCLVDGRRARERLSARKDIAVEGLIRWVGGGMFRLCTRSKNMLIREDLLLDHVVIGLVITPE